MELKPSVVLIGGQWQSGYFSTWSETRLKGMSWGQACPGQSTWRNSQSSSSCSLICSNGTFAVQSSFLQLWRACLMTVAASRLLPVPIGRLHVGQLFLSTWHSCRRCQYFKQGEQTKWPRGQEGTGTSLGSLLQTLHSTKLCCSSAIFLSFETSAVNSFTRLFVSAQFSMATENEHKT